MCNSPFDLLVKVLLTPPLSETRETEYVGAVGQDPEHPLARGFVEHHVHANATYFALTAG